MTRWAVAPTRARLAVLLLAVAALPVPLRGQVMRCTEGMKAIADESMQLVVDSLRAARPALDFQRDDQPCVHAKETARAVSRTVGRNYLGTLAGYEFVKAVDGEGYFTIERFVGRRPRDLQRLATALAARRARRLAIEANVSYDVVRTRDGLVLMITSAAGRDDHLALFRRVQPLFAAPPGGAPAR